MTDLARRRGVESEVYEPAEDSSLLVAAVLEHVDVADRVLDVGTGTGYVARRVAIETGATVVGSDVNPVACARARETGIDVVRGDVTTPFRAAVFDVVAFNPPYLPAVPDADWDDWLGTALTGGPTGRAVIERFLDDVGRVLTPDGSAFLVVSTYTGVDAVVADAGERGFSVAAEADVAFPGETLTALRLWK